MHVGGSVFCTVGLCECPKEELYRLLVEDKVIFVGNDKNLGKLMEIKA